MNRRLFLAAGLGAAACNRLEITPISVRLGLASADLIYNLPIVLAEQLDFYKDAGLDLELKEGLLDEDSVKGLRESTLDVASGFYGSVLANSTEELELRAFLNLQRYPGMVLVASPKSRSPRSRLQDLRGARAGMLTSEGESHDFLHQVLRRIGLPLDSVQMQDFSRTGALVEAVANGGVDAAVLTEPLLAEVQRDIPKVPILIDTRTPEGVREAYGVGEYPGLVIFSTAEWVETNDEACIRLSRAIRRTLAWITSHTAAQISEKMPQEYRRPDPVVYENALVSAMSIFSANGEMQYESAEAAAKIFSASRGQASPESGRYSETFTNDFVERALREGS